MTDLESIIEAGEDLMSKVEEASGEVSAATEAIDETLRTLSDHASYLVHEIAALKDKSPHKADPVALATVVAIDNLLKLLTEAKNYFAAGNDLAAFGTLVMFDDHAEDLRAAFRLCRMQQRQNAGRTS